MKPEFGFSLREEQSTELAMRLQQGLISDTIQAPAVSSKMDGKIKAALKDHLRWDTILRGELESENELNGNDFQAPYTANAPHVLRSFIARKVVQCFGEILMQAFPPYDAEKDIVPIPHVTLENLLDEQIERTVSAWYLDRYNSYEVPEMNMGTDAGHALALRVEHDFPLPKTMDAYLRVRGALVRTMTPDDFPKVEETYEQVRIQEHTLDLLCSNDTKKHEDYRRETSKGVFVYGFNEPQGKERSVAQFMKEELGVTRLGWPTYQGLVLEDGNGDLLAWMTFWQWQRNVVRQCSDEYMNRMKELFQHGVTGNMTYADPLTPEDFEKISDRISEIDTLRGVVEFAMRRLVNAYSSKVHANSPLHKPQVIAYILRDLLVDPIIKTLNYRPVLLSENHASNKFFNKRGFSPFAFDYNPKGFPVKRFFGGMMRKMHTAWTWVVADGAQMKQKSAALWRQDQVRHADFRPDDA